jgi:hypothetical protein
MLDELFGGHCHGSDNRKVKKVHLQDVPLCFGHHAFWELVIGVRHLVIGVFH